MVPRQPSLTEPRKSFRMPSLNVFGSMRRRPQRAREPEEAYELDNTVSASPFATGMSNAASELRGASAAEINDGKPSILPDSAGSVSRKEGDYEAALRQYEKDLKAFDRIRWVDLHVKHATVGTQAAIRLLASIVDTAANGI